MLITEALNFVSNCDGNFPNHNRNFPSVLFFPLKISLHKTGDVMRH